MIKSFHSINTKSILNNSKKILTTRDFIKKTVNTVNNSQDFIMLYFSTNLQYTFNVWLLICKEHCYLGQELHSSF